MKITILTTISNPDQREDKWKEALQCYLEFADEVVVVNGGEPIKCKASKGIDGLFLYIESIDVKGKDYVDKTEQIFLPWSYEWNWIELPRHLNEGLKHCTSDWIIKLDIDQLIHERHFNEIKQKLAYCPSDCEVATMQKMSFTYGKKYYQKGEQPICFRNLPYIRFGRNLEKETDLCFPIHLTGVEVVYQDDKVLYELPIGKSLKQFKTGVKYFNYDYYFKTKEFTKKEFWRFSKAWYRYFNSWRLGDSEEKAFKVFLDLAKSRYDKAPYTGDENTHPKWMREAVKNLTPEQFGYSGWGMI